MGTRPRERYLRKFTNADKAKLLERVGEIRSEMSVVQGHVPYRDPLYGALSRFHENVDDLVEAITGDRTHFYCKFESTPIGK